MPSMISYRENNIITSVITKTNELVNIFLLNTSSYEDG